MSGIYLHIPFCRRACTYCNFHFSTNVSGKSRMVECLLREMEMRSDFFESPVIDSIYFGGGTPSVLDEKDLGILFEGLHHHFDLTKLNEVTMEANPDDLDPGYLKMLADTPVNRLSIGIQCLDDEILKWMNRSHSKKQAMACIENALLAGFELLTADLIYGIPGREDEAFLEDLKQFSSWGLRHFSAYALTVEPKTALAHWIKSGKTKAMPEEKVARQFELLMEAANRYGYEHYEISNFAKPGFRAVHNSSYWSGKPYLGIGPSAHSYDGKKRSWNIANNALYSKAIEEGKVLMEVEKLTPRDRYNEYVMTGLRLAQGISVAEALKIYPPAISELKSAADKFLGSQHLAKTTAGFRLSQKGKLIADHICSEFMCV